MKMIPMGCWVLTDPKQHMFALRGDHSGSGLGTWLSARHRRTISTAVDVTLSAGILDTAINNKQTNMIRLS